MLLRKRVYYDPAANRYLGRITAYDEPITGKRSHRSLESELHQSAGAGFNWRSGSPGRGHGWVPWALGGAWVSRSFGLEYHDSGHYLGGPVVQADASSLDQRAARTGQQIEPCIQEAGGSHAARRGNDGSADDPANVDALQVHRGALPRP